MSSVLKSLIVDDDEITRELLTSYVKRHDALELIGVCDNGIEAINLLRKRSVDVIFLDVEMPEMSGLELIKSLRNRPQIVLITGEEKYAVTAFKEAVIDYLLKPVSYARFAQAVDRVLHQVPREIDATPGDFVFVKSNGKLIKIDLNRIKWIEAQSDYMLIFADREKYLIHSTMKNLVKKLPSSDFIRVHRSYIVRIDQINDIDDTTIVIDKKVIPIGASFKNQLLSGLNTL